MNSSGVEGTGDWKDAAQDCELDKPRLDEGCCRLVIIVGGWRICEFVGVMRFWLEGLLTCELRSASLSVAS